LVGRFLNSLAGLSWQATGIPSLRSAQARPTERVFSMLYRYCGT
jgi:hypothetical protein